MDSAIRLAKDPPDVDPLLVGRVGAALQDGDQDQDRRVDGKRDRGQKRVEPEQVAGEGEQGQDVDHRRGHRHPHEVGRHRKLADEGVHHEARLGVAEKAERQAGDVTVEVGAHARERPLGDQGLEDVDQVLAAAGDQHGAEVIPAVDQQQVDFAQGDGLVDDALLHLERQHPRKDRHDDHRQQRQLQLEVAIEHPGVQGAFGDGALRFGHGVSLRARAGGARRFLAGGAAPGR